MIQFNGSFLPKAHAALTPSRFRVQTQLLDDFKATKAAGTKSREKLL